MLAQLAALALAALSSSAPMQCDPVCGILQVITGLLGCVFFHNC